MAADDTKPSPIDALALARRAGLDRAAVEFPEDVRAAADAAVQALRACTGGESTDEPWPPMRVRTMS